MYAHQEVRSVEEVCYDEEHVQEIIEVIQNNFNDYFEKFIESEGGYGVSAKKAKEIANALGITSNKPNRRIEDRVIYKSIISDSIENFENDREKYIKIFDDESLEEYEDDTSTFKSVVLRNECPIIHSTIYNKRAKELDKYRHDFSVSDSNELLEVIRNLFEFSEEYYHEFYDRDAYEKINDYLDLELGDLDTDDYTVYGVIGGGIKSHMLYKVYPEIFSNRSRTALWAMWYLTDKYDFNCEMDSEFIMIDLDNKNGPTTQQNYFYPYELFSFYASQIYLLLKEKAIEYGIKLNPEYRYVLVDSFLSFITSEHEEEVSLLSKNIRNGGHAHA